jgi:DNA primase
MSNDTSSTAHVKDTVYKHLSKVRPAGPDNLVAVCPFHDDSNPSFAIDIHTGLWLCYACGEKGNFKSFLSKLGMSRDEIRFHYGKTLEELKQNAPPPPDPSKPGVVMESNRRIPEELLGIFHRCPRSLLADGYSRETLKSFGVGVDLLHKRITYPLRDLMGHLVGISGRSINDASPIRYKVYKEEYKTWDLPPYETDKKCLLWNAHRVLPEIMNQELPKIVIVEGFKACMWLTQAGIPNVVALMTKTMSWEQKWILEQMSDSHVLMLDNDEAGMDGYVTISRELAKCSPLVKIVEYDKPQPTDVPLEELPQLIASAVNYNEIMVA